MFRFLILVINLISIKLCYEISKKNNYNVTLWTIFAIITGYFSLIILLIITIVKKQSTKGQRVLLIALIFLSIGTVIYYKPTHIEKVYYGNVLDNGKLIKKNIPITIDGKIYIDSSDRKQIDGTMKLFAREYSLNYLLSEDNGYQILPLDKERNLENQLYLSEDFESITIIFDDSDKEYSGYKIDATSAE